MNEYGHGSILGNNFDSLERKETRETYKAKVFLPKSNKQQQKDRERERERENVFKQNIYKYD